MQPAALQIHQPTRRDRLGTIADFELARPVNIRNGTESISTKPPRRNFNGSGGSCARGGGGQQALLRIARKRADHGPETHGRILVDGQAEGGEPSLGALSLLNRASTSLVALAPGNDAGFAQPFLERFAG